MSSWIESQFERTAAAAAAADKASESATVVAPRSLFDVDFAALDESVLVEHRDLFGAALLPPLVVQGRRLRVYSVRMARLLADGKHRSLRRSVRSTLGLRRARDLVHAVCALYDNSLPDLGVSNVYDCICDHKALTVFVVEEDDAASSAVEGPSEFKKFEEKDGDEDGASSVYEKEDCLSEVEKSVPEAASVFKELFTDAEDEDEDDEEDEADDQDNTQGVGTFIENARSQSEPSGRAFLKRLAAACTIRKVTTFTASSRLESVIDLELLCVRSKYRRQRIGRYLIDLVKNRFCVGAYDVIVTSSDFDAIKFYENADFSLDPILNSKYGAIGDVWTNTTRMCYLPPYEAGLGDSLSSAGLGELSYLAEVEAMERDFVGWQKSFYNLYQSQVQLFMKLKKDVVRTKASLLVKDKVIEELRLENDLLKRKMRFLELKERLLAAEDNDGENKSTSTPANEP